MPVALRHIETLIPRTQTAPSNTVAPAITGNKWQGNTLTGSTGTWDDDGSGVKTYLWKHADDFAFTTNAANATNANTGSTYAINSAEVTKYFRLTVTDTDGIGATSANSAVIGPIGYAYAPTTSAGKIDICANSLTPTYTRGASTSTGLHSGGPAAFVLLFQRGG